MTGGVLYLGDRMDFHGKEDYGTVIALEVRCGLYPGDRGATVLFDGDRYPVAMSYSALRKVVGV